MDERKAFDETKAGVKGLYDSGITEIPAMFHAPPDVLASLKATSPSHNLTIPTIDLQVGDLTVRRSLVEKIGEAAEKWGFFQVINHGIPQDTLDRMIKGIGGFHEQDQEVKKRFYTRERSRKVAYYSNVDLFSSDSATWKDSLTFNMDPDVPVSEDLPEVFGEIVVEYSKEVLKLGEFLLELLSEALGLNPNHLKELGCNKLPTIVTNYYPPCPQPDLTLGIFKHTDISFFTILLQSNIRGLQILHDETWIEVPPIPGALIVNIGDLLQLLSNDKFISVEHRAMANGSSEARISVACFFHMLTTGNPQGYGPIKEILSKDNPPKYRDSSQSEFNEIFSSKGITGRRLLLFRI